MIWNIFKSFQMWRQEQYFYPKMALRSLSCITFMVVITGMLGCDRGQSEQQVFKAKCNQSLAATTGLVEQIASLTLDDGEIQLLAIDSIRIALDNQLSSALIKTYFHPQSVVRKAANECKDAVEKVAIGFYGSAAIYQQVQGLDLSTLDVATQHMVNKLLREFRAHGAHLNGKSRVQLSTKDSFGSTTSFDNSLGGLNAKWQQRIDNAKNLGYPSFAVFALESRMLASAFDLEHYIAIAEIDARVLMRDKFFEWQDISNAALTDITETFGSNSLAEEIFTPDPWETIERLNTQSKTVIKVQSDELQRLLIDAIAKWFEIEMIPNSEDQLFCRGQLYSGYFMGQQKGDICIDFSEGDRTGKDGFYPLQRGVVEQQISKAYVVENFIDYPDLNPAHTLVLIEDFGKAIYHLMAGEQAWWGNAGLSAEPEFQRAVSVWFRKWFIHSGILQQYLSTQNATEVEVAKWAAEFQLFSAANDYRDIILSKITLAILRNSTLLFSEEHLKKIILDELSVGQFAPDAFANNRIDPVVGDLLACEGLCYEPLMAERLAQLMFEPIEQWGAFDKHSLHNFRDDIMKEGSSRSGIDLISVYLQRPISINEAINIPE